MKNLMRVLSILIAIVGITLIITTIAEPKYGDDLYEFAYKVTLIFSASILPLISIAACAYCLERNDTNYLIRIIPIYMSIPILLCSIMVFFEIDAEWLNNVYQFLSKTFSGVTLLSLILVIKPNNKITKILSFLAFGLLATNVILEIISQVKASMVSTLPNVYGYQNYGGFNFSTVEETNEFVSKVHSITSIAQIFVMLLLYITNYAFSDKIEIETENIDYEAVKQDALNVANNKMNNIYNSPSKEEEPVQTTTDNNKGLMNINNQLGQDSNVGTVKEQAKTMNVEGSSLDSLMPMSRGPVINDTNSQTQVQNVQQEVKVDIPVQTEVTTQSSMDIQEEMKQRLEQANQQQNINQNQQINNQ